MRVLIVANDPLVRAGLTTLLEEQGRCTVVGQTLAQPDLGSDLEVYRPDIVVWDLGWDSATALTLLADLQDNGAPPIVALLPDATHAAEAWAAGARGLLLRDADAATLHAAVEAVGQGLTVLAPELTSASFASARARGQASLTEELTPRELEVLRLLAEGLSNKAIAPRLGITEHTVKFHLNSILGKLGAQSRTEAIVLATRQGLIHL